jgi:hypothetical protein
MLAYIPAPWIRHGYVPSGKLRVLLCQIGLGSDEFPPKIAGKYDVPNHGMR